MAKNRYNTPQPVDYAPRKEVKTQEVALVFRPCLICHKNIKEGYWGRYQDGGVCSKSCDIVYQHTRLSLIDYVIVKE